MCIKISGLSLWNYYVKDGKREGANIGFDPEALASILGCNIHRLYGLERVLSGPVVYDQKLQKEQLRGMFIEAQKKIEAQKTTEEQNDTIGWLIADVNTRRVFFKHSAFADEQEYQFVLVENDTLRKVDAMVNANPGNVPGGELKDAPKFYEYKNGFYTSYYQLEFSWRNEPAIKNITLAPSSQENFRLRREGLCRLLQHRENDRKVPVKPSQIPVRY